MARMDTAGAVEAVEGHRGRLFAIAYRMLGQVQEAEDLVQEAYLRWHQADQTEVRTPLPWLVTVVTRLSIDRLRRRRSEQTTYVGSWLPEPMALEADAADAALGREADLSMAFLVMLERLRPEERAAFVLREVFDESYAEIGRVLEKSEAAVRQVVHRARAKLREARPRARTAPDERRRVLVSLMAAIQRGDREALVGMLAEDVTFISDGGGKVFSIVKPVAGPDHVSRLLAGIETKWGALFEHRLAIVNGELAVATYVEGYLMATTSIDVEDGLVRRFYRVMNPDKLRHLAGGGDPRMPWPARVQDRLDRAGQAHPEPSSS